MSEDSIELSITGNALIDFWEAVNGLAGRTLPSHQSEVKFIRLRRALRPYIEEVNDHKAKIAKEHTIEGEDDAESMYRDKAKMQNRLNELGTDRLTVDIPKVEILSSDLPKERKTKENQEAVARWAADLPVEIYDLSVD